MFSAISKIRPGIIILTATFIGLITSGARRYGETDDLLATPEIAVLFIAGFLISAASGIINFSVYDFTKPYRQWRLVKAVVFFLVITLLLALFYILLLSHFKPVLIENRSRFQAWGRLFQWGIFRCSLINVFILILKFSSDSNKARREALLKSEMLQNENILAKYEALKQQVNPHFLFNSLNSLKSLIELDRDRSVEFVIRLSEVYRYLLRHGVNGTVTLKEEHEFLQAYIFLLEMRYGSNLCIDIHLPEPYLKTIMPPVSLQLLIENAVKHNIISTLRPLKVMIGIHDNCILVENVLQPRYSVGKSEKTGLATLDHRYQLLTGKGIRIETHETKFSVHLPLIYET